MYQVQAMQIIAKGYANYDIWGRQIKKIIAWGAQNVLRVCKGYANKKG